MVVCKREIYERYLMLILYSGIPSNTGGLNRKGIMIHCMYNSIFPKGKLLRIRDPKKGKMRNIRMIFFDL